MKLRIIYDIRSIIHLFDTRTKIKCQLLAIGEWGKYLKEGIAIIK